MTNQTDSDRPTSTDPIREDNDSKALSPDNQWERDDPAYDKPDTNSLNDPPERGFNYYNKLIDLNTCSYTYLKNGSYLQFSWQGEIHDIDEFKKALFRLYKSTYKSNLSAADLRPKAFETFVTETVSEQLKATLSRKPIEGPLGPRNQASHRKINERIAGTLSAAAALACEHRTQLGRRARSKDAVVKSVLPEHACEQSA